MKPTDFATDVFPLHATALRRLVSCPWGAVISFLDVDDCGISAERLHEAASIGTVAVPQATKSKRLRVKGFKRRREQR